MKTPASLLTMPKPLRTIRGHTAYARFLWDSGDMELDANGDLLIVREIPRPKSVPSPYVYSETAIVHRYRGREVVISETCHNTYKVFAVSDL